MTNNSEAELGNSEDSTSASTNSSPSFSSGNSNLSEIFDITGDIKIRFKKYFDRLMKARNYTFDEICFSVIVVLEEILRFQQ
jgi:hypothetical protein